MIFQCRLSDTASHVSVGAFSWVQQELRNSPAIQWSIDPSCFPWLDGWGIPYFEMHNRKCASKSESIFWMNTMWLKKKLRNAALSSTQMLREFFLMCSKRHDLRARSRYFTEHNAGLCSRKDDFYYEDANWLPYSSGGSSTSGPQEGKIQIVLLLKAKFCWLKSRVPVKRRWFNRNLARTSRC